MRRNAGLLVVAVAVSACAGCGGGVGPRFEPAADWNVLSRHGELAAANVPFAAADRSMQSPPAQTVAKLPRGGIVIWVMYFRDWKSDFPRRRLPLRVEQGTRSNPFEGFRCAPAVTMARCFAASGSIRRLEARHGSYAVDVLLFFGNDHPRSAQVSAANAELARLQLG